MDENELNEWRQKIQGVLTDGQAKLSEITAIADGSKQKEVELNTYHSRIIELKVAAETSSNALSETYNSALLVKQQIDELHRLVTETKTTIETKAIEIETYYTTFTDLRKKADNPETGIAAVLEKSTELFGQISKTNTDVTLSKEEIITNKVKSDGILSETGQLKSQIATHLLDSKKLKDEIGEILDLVRDTGLANSFDKRRKRSQYSSLIALSIIIVGICISVVSIYKVFLTIEGQALFDKIENDYIKFLLRLTLTAPGVFTAWFGAVQYSKERYFLEQYEFKTAAALALENYTKLLKDNYAKKEDDIFKLSLELIRSVYKEPSYIKPRNSILAKIKAPIKNIGTETQTEE